MGKNRRPIRTPHHTKQRIPANKQKPQKTTIIPMKLIPANKQTTFKKTAYKCDSSQKITGTKIGIRYHTLTKKEKKKKSCLNLAWTLVGQTYIKKKKEGGRKAQKKKKRGKGRTKKKKKKKKK